MRRWEVPAPTPGLWALGSSGQRLTFYLSLSWGKENLFSGAPAGVRRRPQLSLSAGGCCGSLVPTYLDKQVSQARRRSGADTSNSAVSAAEKLGAGPAPAQRDWHRRAHTRVPHRWLAANLGELWSRDEDRVSSLKSPGSRRLLCSPAFAGLTAVSSSADGTFRKNPAESKSCQLTSGPRSQRSCRPHPAILEHGPRVVLSLWPCLLIAKMKCLESLLQWCELNYLAGPPAFRFSGSGQKGIGWSCD